MCIFPVSPSPESPTGCSKMSIHIDAFGDVRGVFAFSFERISRPFNSEVHHGVWRVSLSPKMPSKWVTCSHPCRISVSSDLSSQQDVPVPYTCPSEPRDDVSIPVNWIGPQALLQGCAGPIPYLVFRILNVFQCTVVIVFEPDFQPFRARYDAVCSWYLAPDTSMLPISGWSLAIIFLEVAD